MTYVYPAKLFILKHLRSLLVIFALGCITPVSYGQSGKGTISGTVKDSLGRSILYASVYLEGTTYGANTNEQGNYSFTAPEGNYTLAVSVFGYTKQSKSITVKAGEKISENFSLNEDVAEFEEIVISGTKRRTSAATKTSTPLEDLPMSIQIVDKELMQQQQVIDTRDAVKNVSGLTVTGTYNGGYTTFNSRGFWMNNWSNFRRNGMMIWNMGHHHNDNIEQIEVLKGPASVLYGDVAPGGVMNFVTKKPLSYNYRRFEMRVGEYGLFRPTIDLSGPANDKGTLLYRLNATYEKSNSFRNEVKNETVMLSPALTWIIHPKLVWDVEGVYKADERVGDPGIVSPDGTFEGVKKLPISTFLGEPNATYSFKERNLFSTLTFYVNPNWKIRNQTYYSETNRTPYNIYLGAVDSVGNLTRSQYYYHQYWRGWGNSFDLIGEFKTGKLNHQALIGFDYMINGGKWTEGIDETMDTTINVYNPQYGLPNFKADPMIWSNFKNFYERTGIYVQDQIAAFDNKLQLLLGARYNITRQGNDYDKKSDEPANYKIPVDKLISPRFGLVYKPIKNMSVYGSYSQSYEMNGIDWIDPSKLIAPTDASQAEFGVKTSLLKDHLGITMSVFQINKKNIYNWIDAVTEPAIPYISWDQGGQWATYQGGHHRSQGIEFDVHGKLFNALTINATYAYVDAFVVEDPAYKEGAQLEGNAKNSGSLWLNYAFRKKLKGFEVGYGIFYKDKFYMSTANDPEELVKSFHSMDASIAYNYKQFTTRVNVTNFTNNKGYTGSRGVYEPYWVRRTILSVAVKF